jgi:hypothetical protein
MVKKGKENGLIVFPGGGITERNLKRILDGCNPQGKQSTIHKTKHNYTKQTQNVNINPHKKKNINRISCQTAQEK